MMREPTKVEDKKAGSGKILTLALKDKNSLFRAYMPFIKNGGLFVPTPRQYSMGEEIFMLLSLPDDPDNYPVAGKVVWKNPKGAQGHHPTGIGVQLSDQDGGLMRNRIETLLAGMLKADRRTHTM